MSDQEHNFHLTYRPDIDGLRAVAILSVVVFHAFPSVLRGGFVGVDVFFVISGFLISIIVFKSLMLGRFSFAEFYAHRIKRIFPALLVVLLAAYILGWFVLLPDEYKQLGRHIVAGAGFVQNFVMWKESGYFDTASELKPLMHLWSLAIEEQFYLFYPLFVWAAWRIGLKIFAPIVLIGVLSFGLNVQGVEKDAVKTFFLLHTRMWELMAGGGLAYLYVYNKGQFADWARKFSNLAIFRATPSVAERDAFLNNLISILGLLLIAGSVVGLHKELLFPGWWALPPVIGSFLLIFAGPNAWVNRKILANRIIVFIGVISYPVYLWHWMLLSFLRIAVSEMPSLKMRVAAVLLSFVLAWLTYRFFEKPIRFGAGSNKLTISILALVMVAIAYLAYPSDTINEHSPYLFPKGERRVSYFELDSKKRAYLQAERQRVRRWPVECNFGKGIPAYDEDVFRSKVQGCLNAGSKGQNILIFGDSHAADIWGGLSREYPEINFLQATGGACPVTTKSLESAEVEQNCKKLISYVYNEMSFSNIRTILITMRWRNDIDLEQLFGDVMKLQAKGLSVIILGPTVEFTADLPTLILRGENPDLFYKQDRFELDERMQQYFTERKIKYVSMVKVQCPSSPAAWDCAWFKDKNLLIFDDSHFTDSGMRYFAKVLRNQHQIE